MSILTQNSAQISHILGIDFGQSKIGLALADTETRMAFAYDTLQNDQKFQEKLAEIVDKEKIEKIIIGIPSYIYPHTKSLRSKNISSSSCDYDSLSYNSKSRNFGVGVNRKEVEYEGEKLGKIIEKELKISVDYQNEMFTTKMAQANLIEKGIKGIKKHDDEEAARIILQEWLDRTV